MLKSPWHNCYTFAAEIKLVWILRLRIQCSNCCTLAAAGRVFETNLEGCTCINSVGPCKPLETSTYLGNIYRPLAKRIDASQERWKRSPLEIVWLSCHCWSPWSCLLILWCCVPYQINLSVYTRVPMHDNLPHCRELQTISMRSSISLYDR